MASVPVPPPRPARQRGALWLGGLVLAAWLAVDLSGGFQVSGLFCLCPLVVAVSASTRWTLIASAAAMTAAVASGAWHDNLGSNAWAVRLVGCAVGCVAATLVARRMERDR